uniref:Uncharacterized protein n=2 Tax=Arundo donax TaxID=35708 RepID=A0A0A8ZR42_ARUDO
MIETKKRQMKRIFSHSVHRQRKLTAYVLKKKKTTSANEFCICYNMVQLICKVLKKTIALSQYCSPVN